ncbi:perlucin-like protein isoform X2 [Mercenaria mercenaria]|nr:perlucin-like protein isoform X2 [Mercenaria mercenaria]
MLVVIILVASGIFHSAFSRPTCQSAFDYKRHVLRKLVEFMDAISSTKDGTEGTESSDTTCPDMWVTFQGSCYLFANQRVIYSEAERFCQQHESHLVHVDNVHENNFLQDMMRNRLRENNWWSGLTDREIEGKWQWVDTDKSPDFTDWYPGQPNNSGNEDCGVFWASHSFHWGDLGCTHKAVAICEK